MTAPIHISQKLRGASGAAPRALPRRAHCLHPVSVLAVARGLGCFSSIRSRCPARATTTWCCTPESTATSAVGRTSWLTRRPPAVRVYNKSLNIIPIEELPHHRVSWDRHTERYETGILHEHADAAHNIFERIRAQGPLSTAAFAEHDKPIDWWWAPTRVARAVLEALFVTGRVGVARRDGNRRITTSSTAVAGETLEQRRS